jgi:hypothetical protein
MEREQSTYKRMLAREHATTIDNKDVVIFVSIVIYFTIHIIPRMKFRALRGNVKGSIVLSLLISWDRSGILMSHMVDIGVARQSR